MLGTVDSPVGYGEKNRVMTWLVGLPGNTCGPPQGAAFSLANGGVRNSPYAPQGISINGSGPA